MRWMPYALYVLDAARLAEGELAGEGRVFAGRNSSLSGDRYRGGLRIYGLYGMCVVQLTHVDYEGALCFQNITGCPVTGLLLIAAAIYMFANPAIPLVVLGYVFSISVWLGGVFELVRYFGTPKPARTGWDLVDGILTVVAGLILLTASVGAEATFIPTIVGTWMIMWALIRLMTAQGVKYLSYAAGRHLQLSAIGTLILGFSWCCSRR